MNVAVCLVTICVTVLC